MIRVVYLSETNKAVRPNAGNLRHIDFFAGNVLVGTATRGSNSGRWRCKPNADKEDCWRNTQSEAVQWGKALAFRHLRKESVTNVR